jgi:ABC-2 type transport system ATP-binding protein
MRIDIDDLTLRYGDTTALDGVSLTVEGPGILGLLGRNGAGKTSLLAVLAAFRRASGGSVTVAGEPVWENATVTRQICFIRGEGDTVRNRPEDKVRDAFAFAERFRPQWSADAAAELADRFELDPKASLSELSTGKRSAVGVILGLASRAPITIFDESYLGIDAPGRQLFYDAILAEQIAHPRTFILSTHLIDEVAALFEGVAILHHGRLLLHEDAEQLRSRGATLTGTAEAVADVAEGLEVLGSRELGPTRELTVLGDLDRARAGAARAGVEVGPVGLQDLFIHLTEGAAR